VSEIVECSNVGSCGYGIKDKLVVYPLFKAQHDFIMQQQADTKELADEIVKLKARNELLEKVSESAIDLFFGEHSPDQFSGNDIAALRKSLNQLQESGK